MSLYFEEGSTKPFLTLIFGISSVPIYEFLLEELLLGLLLEMCTWIGS